MPINASIAVLTTDSALAQSVVQQISGFQSFSAPNHTSGNSAEPAITFGESITLTAIAAESYVFDPPQLGSYLAWGADIALLVVDSSLGLDGESIQRAQEVAQFHPLMVAVTGLDSPRANFDETLAVISRVMDQQHHAVAITLPVLSEAQLIDESEVGGILDLVAVEIKVPGPDGEPISHELEQAHFDLIEAHLEALTNAVIVTSTDENLIHSVLEHGFESPDQMRKQLLSATARREIIPVFAISDAIGVSELANFACGLTLEPWAPVQLHGSEVLASAIGNGCVRIWNGEFTLGEYFADNASIGVTSIYSIAGHKKIRAYAGEIVRIEANQEIRAGSSISSVKSNPLAVGHVFE